MWGTQVFSPTQQFVTKKAFFSTLVKHHITVEIDHQNYIEYIQKHSQKIAKRLNQQNMVY
jgi:hypothetical protein